MTVIGTAPAREPRLVAGSVSPELTVVIPCRNDARLGRAIQSARHPMAEVLVVLNAPSSHVRAVAKQQADRVIEISEPNLARARQAGVNAASASSVLFLDSDCWLAPSAIDEVLWGLADSDIVRLKLSYGANTRAERLVARVREHTTVNTKLPLLPLALRTSIAQRIGGYLFDPRLAWGEDWDLAMRIYNKGVVVKTITHATIFHEALSISSDLASATRIGWGRFLQSQANLLAGRRLLDDILFAGEARNFICVHRRYGMAAAVYHLFGWRLAYKLGYHFARMRGYQQ